MRASADGFPAEGHARCALHPSRPALDRCPVCGRPRCRADADRYGAAGCEACARTSPPRAAATSPELVVRAGLGAVFVAYFGGWVGTQYVRVHLMSLLAPGLTGIIAAWVVSAVARGLPRRRIHVVAVVGALLGAALGFRLVPGGESPLHPVGTVLGPYLAAVAGVALWPLLFAAPRRQPPGEGEPDDGIAL